MRVNVDRAKSDNATVHQEADILAPESALEPGAEILPAFSDGESFNNDSLKVLA